MSTIVVFGTGSSAASFLANLDESVQVCACLDNNIERQGTVWNGVPVLPPDRISELAFDYVVIASQFVKPIYQQLIGLGIASEKIVPLYPAHYTSSLLDEYQKTLKQLYRQNSRLDGKPAIRLLTMNRSGCNARALYTYAPPEMLDQYDIRLITDFAKEAADADCIVTTHRNGSLSGNGINVELWHGMPLKAMGRLNAGSDEDRAALENWMSVHGVASCSAFYTTVMNACVPTTAKPFEITGLPRNDHLFHSKGRLLASRLFDQSLSGRKIAWYMPTFRVYSSRGIVEGDRDWRNLFDFPQFDEDQFEQFLQDHNLFLIVKLHPFEEKIWQDRIPSGGSIGLLTERMLNEQNLDMYELLNSADVLLTDYSSVYFDYLLLDRPIVFTPTDLEAYRRTRGLLLEPYEWWAPGDLALSQEELEKSLLSALDQPDKHAERRETIRRIVHAHHDGNASARVWAMVDRLLTEER